MITLSVRRRATLATGAELVIEGDALPTRFCLFKAGPNETSKGVFILDAADRDSVKAIYEAQGTDLMIDLEHESLDDFAVRPDSRDARGWAKLEFPPDGSCWAVDIRWTPDGAARLRNKTQRYTSPAFHHDEEGHIKEIVNVALVAMPATYHNAPLVAASHVLARRARRATVLSTMDPKDVQAAIDALKNNDPAAALALLEKILVSAAGGTPADAAPDAGALAEGGAPAQPDPSAVQAAALSRAFVVALSAALIKPPAGVETLSADLCRTLGKPTVSEALVELASMRKRIESLDADRAALELSQRRELIASLIELRSETPATAWDATNDPERKARNPVARLMAEPIDALRARVTELRAGAPQRPSAPETRPEGESRSVSERAKSLTSAQLSKIKAQGLTLDEFFARADAGVRRIV